MDSIADAENEDVHIVTGEKTPLTRGDLGSRGKSKAIFDNYPYSANFAN